MSWKKVKLANLCTIEKGKTGIQKAIPGEYPLVVTAEDRKSHNEYQFDDEAVIIPLVSGTGHGHASIKRLHFQSGKFALGTILCAVIPKDKTVLNAEYLFRFLNLNKERELVDRMKGMANVTLPIKEIAKIEIPLPNLEEQIEFVEKYALLETDSEDISSVLTYQLDLIKQLRQSFLREAMQGKLIPVIASEARQSQQTGQQLLDKIKAEKAQHIAEKKLKKEKPLPVITAEEIPFEIPEHWAWCRLGEIGKINGGGTPSMGNPEYWNGSIPWISPKDMKSERICNSQMKVTAKGIMESSTNLIPIGSLLIVGRSGILKRKIPVAINDVECTVNQDMKVIVPHIVNMNRYLQLMFGGIEEIILNKYVKFGMTVHSLKYDEFSKMPIPLPPLDEQEQIVSKLEELMAFCDGLEQSIKESQGYNEMLLQQVLREALQGKKETV